MKRIIITALAAIGLVSVGVAQAAEVKVVSAGAMRAMVADLAELYKKETGNTVTITAGTVGVVRGKLAAGEPADVVISSDTGLDTLIKEHLVVAGTRKDLARTGVGVGVREGAPKPDISTPEAFKQMLLAAKAVAYVDPAQGATSGIHFAAVQQRLGIADAIKPKAVLFAGGYAAEAVAKGQADVVVHQISEILPVKGVTLVGPLPKELQKVTVYSGGIAAKAPSPELARAFLDFLARADFRPKFAAAGLDYRE
ncbi:MAG: substrate-binding domain-containing protein [Candidatus Rokubacteria bacterium]|nr:substrate-binding domain-containing protein [Candidatus Rokubacteria bacterium]